VIRYAISPAQIRARIEKINEDWFDDTAAVLAALPDPPKSSDFKPLWTQIKAVYIELQHSKCCFCEKLLEGNIEQDVEHFRPKAEVKPWKVPDRLAAQGIAAQQPADSSSEPGYHQLAYSPFNYAMACKTCNSTLKKNYFPIEGTRDYGATDPTHLRGEKALLIYPIGSVDDDPQQLITFEALSPVPNSSNGFNRRRALVTIELCRLDDSTRRRPLFKLRAALVRMLFLEMEGHADAGSESRRKKHRTAIELLTSPEMPFTSCLRSFKHLYETDPARAVEIADECLKFMKTKSRKRHDDSRGRLSHN
jgi:hypothetical protein